MGSDGIIGVWFANLLTIFPVLAFTDCTRDFGELLWLWASGEQACVFCCR